MELLNLPFPANSGKETEQKPLLSVERLHKRFGLHEVLKDVSFSCSPGEIVAIVGPNAAGKSTLGKLLSGLLKEDGGTIRFAEKPLKKSSRREMIWYIMQDLDSQLFGEGITIYEDKIYQITWRSRKGFIYDLKTFTLESTFNYNSEGWGITTAGDHLIMSDGSNKLYHIAPSTFNILKEVEVYDHNGPVDQLNELEYVDGMIWALSLIHI